MIRRFAVTYKGRRCFDIKIIELLKVVFKIISPVLLSGASLAETKVLEEQNKTAHQTPIKTHTEACPKKTPPKANVKKKQHFYIIQKSHSASCQPCCSQYP